MGKGQQQRAAAAAAAAAADVGGAAPTQATLADFMFPALPSGGSQSAAVSDKRPAAAAAVPAAAAAVPAAATQPSWGKPAQPAAGPPARGVAAHASGTPLPVAASPAQPGPSYMVMGSKKGGFPVSIEPRAKGKKVTVVHNVTGDLDQLCKDLKGAVGSGGVVRDNNVEVQGEHVARTEAFLLKKGCIKGVSGANKAAALPAAKEAKPQKSIARLDAKAAALKQKQ